MSLAAALEAAAADPLLWSDFLALCDAGGRFAGSDSAAAAFAFAAGRMASIGPVRDEPSVYSGWTCHAARLEHRGTLLDCTPLLGSMACENLTLDVRDLGRGAPQPGRLDGLAVMARHEYPFGTHAMHRRVKLAAATGAGAAAFLIVQPEPGIGPVSGSSGRNGGAGIPALGISAEAADALRQGGPARITIEAVDHPSATPNLILEIPGRGPGLVALTAHLDGHPLGESALDNATGVAAVLCLGRALAPHVTGLDHGLLICLFGAEEWALAGSRAWLAGLDEERRRRIVMNLNLDSIAGHPELTALTSGFPELPVLLRSAVPTLGIHEPLVANSDHANFAAYGIPAARLIAGFDVPDSNLRYLLTAADRRRLTSAPELRAATLTAARLLWAALTPSR